MTTTVEDRLALRALADDYALAIDDRDVERFVGVFTADAELAIYEPGDDEAAMVYRGEGDLRTVLELVAAYAATFHLVANHTCEVDGDTAAGFTYCLAHHLTEPGDGTADDLVMVLRYRDTYRREDGRWRFERRDVLRQWSEHHPADRARLFG